MTSHSFVRLHNGCTLCVAEMPWMESISIGLWTGVGGRHDPASQSGLAHFAEHMLFKGTRRRSARQLNRDIESVGGSMDAYTSEDHTSFFVRGPAERLPRFADVLFDIYRHSRFLADDVKREREVIAEEIAMYREQPAQQVEELLWRTAWPSHPLGRPIAGTEESLANITSTSLRHHAASWFGSRNTIVSVAGRTTLKEVQSLLNDIAPDHLPTGRRPPLRRFRKPQRHQPAVVSEHREIDQVQLAIALHAPSRKDPEAPALRLLNVLLGENTSSRLWASLREDHGLCYDVGSDLTSLDDTGLLHIFAGVDPGKLKRALTTLRRELARLAAKAVSPRALAEACEYAIASSRLALETPGAQMTSMAECLLFHGRWIPIEDHYQRLRSVTPADVHRLAAELFRPGNLTLAMVGPIPHPDSAATWLCP